MQPRVMITGAGVISPLGNNLHEFMEGVTTGKKGISTLHSFVADHFPSKLAAEVKLESAAYLSDTAIDKKIIFLQRALTELFRQPKILEQYSPSQRVLNLGCGLDYFDLPGYVQSPDKHHHQWQTYSKNALHAIQQLASQYQIQGGVNVNVSACVASNHALGLSLRQLRQVPHQLIITGGVDSMINPLHYMGFYKLGALSNWHGDPAAACRPFDKHRRGLVLGEGAAVLFLQAESEAHPSHILAELVGYSATMDAYMVTDPHPQGIWLAKAALNAIQEAGITPAQIDCVHLHGTGTPKNDLAEAQAMKLIFGNRFQEIPVFSLKGQVGHLIGACGAMELLGVIYSLQQQQVPPTVNFEYPDPEVPLRVITQQPLEMKIDYVLKLNAAFGGQNSALVVKRVQ